MALLLATACLCVTPIAVSQTSPASPQKRANSSDTQEPPVRLKTDLIEVRAVVTDHAGRLVDNLHQEDFELSEDGQLQTIRFFSLERISEKPAEAAAAPPAKPTTPRNSTGLPTAPPIRTIVLFVDTLHLSYGNLAGIKEALKRFVNEQISDQDLAAIKTSSGVLGLLEQFTRDRQLLRFAIERLRPWGDVGVATALTPYLAAQVVKEDEEAIATAAAIIIKEEFPGVTRQYVINRCREIVAITAYRRRVTLATLQGVANGLAQSGLAPAVSD
jgi:VWFA-related protein